MNIEIREEPVSALAGQAQIPIAFEVARVLDVSPVNAGLGGIALVERPLDAPYIKDYDAIEGEGPDRWAKRFDVSNWGLIAAYAVRLRVGGAVVAFNTDGANTLEGRADLAVLWDIRVLPEWRRRGVGSLLLSASESWAAARGCRQLKIETQNINVAACRFYARSGYVLGEINRFAYADLPDETQLIWYRNLSCGPE
jgi:GNAT superfamily N-acetyltransferase